jgi:sterol desaturase/sphingolipid hydroxylase (fatty acid hydroxylase superfamily)
MQVIIDYFSTIPSLHRTLIIVSGLTFFWIWESIIPLFNFDYRKWKHAGTNLFFTLTTIIVNFALAFVLVKTSDYVVSNKIGLLYLFSLPDLWFGIIGLLGLDLIGAYAVHYVEHKVRWMWMFHLVHHTDQYIDTTSANRHHPGESVFRFVFTTVAVIIIGAPMWLVMLYQSLSVILTQFNHSNIKMASWFDDSLGLIVCTPNMHRVHHHYRQPLTDCNYGNIFSFWDRIFGTYRKVDNNLLTYGLDTYMEVKEAGHIGTILKIPFSGYRSPIDYKD